MAGMIAGKMNTVIAEQNECNQDCRCTFYIDLLTRCKHHVKPCGLQERRLTRGGCMSVYAWATTHYIDISIHARSCLRAPAFGTPNPHCTQRAAPSWHPWGVETAHTSEASIGMVVPEAMSPWSRPPAVSAKSSWQEWNDRNPGI